MMHRAIASNLGIPGGEVNGILLFLQSKGTYIPL